MKSSVLISFKRILVPVLAILALASCDMGFFNDEDSSSSTTTGTISFSCTYETSRSALPDLYSALSSLSATLTDAYGGIWTDSVDDWQSELSFTELTAGTYTLSVEFYNESGTAIASATESCTVLSDQTTSITLTPTFTSDSEGALSLTVTWPDTVEAASFLWAAGTTTDLTDPIAGSTTESFDVSTLSTYTMEESAVEGGEYYLYMKFLDSDGYTLGSFWDTLTIYGGVTTAYWLDSEGDYIDSWDFSEEDFLNGDADLTSLEFYCDDLYYTTEESFTDGTTTEIVLPADETVAIRINYESDGRIVSYSWGDETGSLGSGALSDTLDFSEDEETLTLAVEAPSGRDATYTYEVIKGFAVSFDENGGSWTDEEADASYAADSSIYLPTEEDITLEDYGLAGWTDSEGNFYELEDPVEITEDITFTAVWGAYLRYYSEDSLISQTAITEGEEITVDFDAAGTSSYGYTFAGWDTTDDMDTTVYYKVSDDDKEDSITAGESNINLYAVWVDGTPLRTAGEIQDLAEADAWSGTYYLTRDIDLDGESLTPLGDGSSPFTASLDGWDHTLSNLTLSATEDYYGLIGYLDSDQTVSDLNLIGVSFDGGSYSHTAVVAGYSAGTVEGIFLSGSMTVGGNNSGALAGSLVDGTVSDCFINLDSFSGSGYSLGGAVGYAGGGTLSDCTVIADLMSVSGGTTDDSEQNLGGIVGEISGSGTVSNCSFTGEMNCDGVNAGGISGLAEGTSDSGDITFSLCSVTGSMETIDFSGGIAGYANYATFTSCAVEELTQNISNTAVGGIVGYLSNSDMTSCTVKSLETSGSSLVLGGLVGSCWYSDLTECTGETITLNGDEIMGGIAGFSNDSSFSNCTLNTSTISSTGDSGNVGGIVGSVYDGTSLSNCSISDSSVTGVIYVGGLTGYGVASSAETVASQTDCTISDTTITGESYVGGLFGYASNLKITGCDLSGLTITHPDDADTGDSYFGGLIGMASSVTLETCNLTGTSSSLNSITSPGTYSGGLIGFGTDCTLETLSVTYTNLSGTEETGGAVGYFGQGSSLTSFTGSNITVSGTEYTGGAVGYLINGATSLTSVSLTDLNLSGTSYVGGICGYSYGSSSTYLTLTNCSVEGTIESSSTYAGGIAGRMAYTTLTTCDVEGGSSITSSTYHAGGLAGYATYSTLTGCELSGSSTEPCCISATSYPAGGALGEGTDCTLDSCDLSYVKVSGTTYTGGFIGNSERNDLDDCTGSNITVTGSGSYTGGYLGKDTGSSLDECDASDFTITGTSYTGGYVGSALTAADDTTGTTLESCDGSSLTVKGTEYYVGGFIGSATNLASSMLISLTSCTASGINLGTVTPTESTDYFNYGGFCGYMEDITMTDCSLTGSNTISTDSELVNLKKIGGIAGYANSSTLSNCDVAYLEVEGYQYIGGIVGYSATNTLENCDGDNISVTASYYHAGGIAGYATDTTLKTSTIETLEVEGNKYVGGAVGRIYYSTITGLILTNLEIDCEETFCVGGLAGYAYETPVTSCSVGSSSTVDSIISYYSYCGGLIGYASFSEETNDEGYIEDCSVYASVEGGDRVGGLVGYMDYCSLKNCGYYGASLKTNDSDYLGGAVGYAANSDITYCTVGSSADTIIFTPSGEYNGGLIGGSDDCGEISYNRVTEFNMSPTSSGSNYYGGLIGYASNSTSISQCAISNSTLTFDREEEDIFMGGLIAYVSASTTLTIDQCFADITISSTATSHYVGGLLGYLDGDDNSLTVSNCYAIATLPSDGWGLLANNDSGSYNASFSSCYSYGVDVDGNELGMISTSPSLTVTNCFYMDNGISTITSYGIDLYEVEMQTPDTFNGAFDDTTWDWYDQTGLDINDRYPYLANLYDLGFYN
ncbi:MAG: InlB B-repeat-containing protein [Spirochaetales bacterium]|nr:InlB B-repeat-containing protein [Spirochaetales bacterium]